MTLKDQTGYLLYYNPKPMRIVSLVPSQSELLFDIGLDHEVIGITKFCIHPKKWHKEKNRVGGTKKINFDKIKELNPDLILANKEENTKDDIFRLREQFPVYTSDINDLESALEMIQHIGIITNRAKACDLLISNIKAKSKILRPVSSKTCLYIIWNDPIMVVGKNTYINSIIEKIGLINLANSSSRYPTIDLDEIKSLSPDVLLLSSEPFPFKEKHQRIFKSQLKKIDVILVDGEMFSWYGSRIIKAFDYLKNLNL